jgi:hypothetical protein
MVPAVENRRSRPRRQSYGRGWVQLRRLIRAVKPLLRAQFLLQLAGTHRRVVDLLSLS